MSRLQVYNMAGAGAGEYDLAESLLEFSKGTQAVHDVVVAQQARRRAGTASTLSKGEVSGSNKKPWRQKGTGRARAGYRQSPVWRGGSVVFGPKPRDYGKKTNRKVARLAFRRAFSERVAEGAVRVLESLALDTPRTKAFAAMLKSLNVTRPALFLVASVTDNLGLACRNLPRVDVQSAAEVSVYDVLRYPEILVTRDAMKVIESRLGTAAEAC